MEDFTERKGEALRLIAIDDEDEWCARLKTTAGLYGHTLDSATTLEDAIAKIQAAERDGRPYDVALVDMNFETGRKRIELPRGKEALKYLKAHHPQVACIMISGAPVSPETVLDLRDDFDLDYYLRKEHLDIDTFDRSIRKAVRRARSVGPGCAAEQRLERLLAQWRGVHLRIYENLATASERKALKGLDVDVATLNEIGRYEQELAEAARHIDELERQLGRKDAG